jgi:hypothetical protein
LFGSFEEGRDGIKVTLDKLDVVGLGSERLGGRRFLVASYGQKNKVGRAFCEESVDDSRALLASGTGDEECTRHG